MAVKKRPETIDAPRLRPVTQPVSQFVRPEAPAEDMQLARLAQSLGGISEPLAAFGRAHIRTTAEAGQSEALGLRLRTAIPELSRRLQSGDIPPQVNQTVLEMDHGEDIARQHFEDIRRRYLGESTAGAGQPSNAFDRNQGDLDQWFKQLTQEREGQLPQMPGVLHGWRRMMTGFQQRLYAEHDQYVQQRTVQANLDAAHRSFVGIAVDAIQGGERDPATIHRRMQEAFEQTRRLHLLTPDQTNAAIVSAARSIAEQGIPGNPSLGVALVRELLLGQRQGPGGAMLPALGNSQQYAHLTNQVIEAAQRRAAELQRPLSLETIVRFNEDARNGRLDEEAAKKFIADNPDVLGPSTQAHLESMLLQNRTALDRARTAQQNIAEDIARRARAQASRDELDLDLQRRGDAGTLQSVPERVQILKDNGEPQEIQRAALLDRARDSELARIQEWARQTREAERDIQGSVALETGQPPPPMGGPSLEQRVFERTRDFLVRNGLTHPGWRDTLAGGYAAATPQAVSAAQPPPLLSQAVQLYEQLEAQAPGMLERHIQSQAARDFYRTYRIGRTALRQDERQAMVFAAAATNDVGADESLAPAFRKIEDELNRAQSIFLWSRWITNFGDMRPDITRLTRALVRSGMRPEPALRLAGEDVRQQYTNINGFMVRTGDRAIESYGALLNAAGLQPRSFEESVRRYLERYAEENPNAAPAEPADFLTRMLFPPESGVTPPAFPSRDLSIRPVTEGTGAWAVIDAVTGLPVPSGPNGMRQTIHLRDLLLFEQRTQREEQEREAERLAREARENPPQDNTLRPGKYRAVTREDWRKALGWPFNNESRGIQIGPWRFLDPDEPEEIASGE